MNRNNDRIKRIVASAILLFLSGSYDIMNIKFAVGGKNPSSGSRPQLSIRSVRSYYRPQEPGENPPEKIPRCKSYDGFYQLFNQWNQPWQCLRDHRTRIHHGLRNCQNAELRPWRYHHGRKLYRIYHNALPGNADFLKRAPGRCRVHAPRYRHRARCLQTTA